MAQVVIEAEHRSAAREIIARWITQPAVEKAAQVLTRRQPVSGEERELIHAHSRLALLLCFAGDDDPSPTRLEREQAVALLTSVMLELRYAPEPAKEFVALADAVSTRLREIEGETETEGGS